MTARFVILHHTGHGDEHWDLMLEKGNSLLTWRLAKDPTLSARLPIAAQRIGEHRKAYLDYEGPVSGGRGLVRRVDRGELEWLDAGLDRYEVAVRGSKLCGRFGLQKKGGDWVFHPIPPP